jgi:hypothetical protein
MELKDLKLEELEKRYVTLPRVASLSGIVDSKKKALRGFVIRKEGERRLS